MRNAVLAVVVVVAVSAVASAAIPFERAITGPTYGPPPGSRGVPLMASDGREAAVLWNDLGRGAFYAGRVSANGTPLDDTGVRIEARPWAYGPWFFWAGNAYVLFWTQNPGGLFAARLDSELKVIDPPHAVFEKYDVLSMATNGSRFVAAYGNHLAVFDTTGKLLEQDITMPGIDPSTVASLLVSNGIGFLCAWPTYDPSGTALHVEVLDASGHPKGQPHVVVTPANAPLVAASNGDDYLFILRQTFDSPPYALRVSAAGGPIETWALPVSESGEDVLHWTGANYVYTGVGREGIFALRLESNGAPHDAAPLTIANVYAGHDAAVAGGTLLVAWSTGLAVQAETVNLGPAAFAHGDPVLVSVSAAAQVAPHIAFSGRNYLIVWQELGTIYAARMDFLGRTLDQGGIKIAEGRDPNVVFDGGNYVVAYQARRTTTLLLNRIDPDSGAVLDHDGVPIVTAACGYDLAPSHTATMLAFNDCSSHIQVMRFSRSLAPMDMPLTVTPKGMAATRPSVAWSGTQWLVAFEEQIAFSVGIGEAPPEFNLRGNIRAVRISPALTILDVQPILVASSDDDFIPRRSPHAASSGSDYLITWSKGFPYGDQFEVFGRALFPNGTLGTELRIAATMRDSASTSTIWTGSQYAIGFTSKNGDALGATVDAGGDTSLAFFKVAVTTDTEDSLALVAANGRVTGAYARIALEPLYGGVSRVFVRDARPLHGRVAGH